MADELVYEKGSLPPVDDAAWSVHRKTALTRMLRVVGPFRVMTQEGRYKLPEGWEGWIAVDGWGFPYPIAAAEYELSYEPVEET